MRPNVDVLRSALLPMLTEAGECYRNTGQYEQDPDTGIEQPVLTLVWSGPVLVRPESQADITVGGVEFQRSRYDVTLPAEAQVAVNDVLMLGAVNYDSQLTGARITITDVPLDSWQIARFCKGERTD